MTPKRRKKAPPQSSASPLDAKQRSLEEQETKVRAKVAEMEKLIAEAPKRAEQRARAQREELIARASRTDGRPGNRATLPDRRYGDVMNVAVPAQARRMRKERRQGRLTFFLLFAIFCGMLLWLYYTCTHP